VLEKTAMEMSRYRFERAEQMLKASHTAYGQDDWVTANNRAYYCFFHAMRSVLALEIKDFKRHSAVISHFNQHYIATDLFDRVYGAKLTNAFTIRNHTDYDDFYLFSRDETREMMNDADQFLDDVRKYLTERGVFSGA